MNFKDIAQSTLEIMSLGQYTSANGVHVVFENSQSKAEQGTRRYTPEELQALLGGLKPSAWDASVPHVVVTPESTQVAAKRMVDSGADSLAILNFASARNPGGGFLNGARAQEEDLCRCSGLFNCLMTQPDFYATNKQQASLLYSDNMLYSPQVPWFRTEGAGPLLDEIFLASVITAPAPNAGQYLAHCQGGWKQIQACLLQRCGLLLALAREQGHRQLLLGAWGCGVFGNQPAMVASAFASWLATPAFLKVFERVEFSILDNSADSATFKAFSNRLIGS